MFSLKHTRTLIELIDRFLNTVDQGGIIFREGVRNYLQGNKESFHDNLMTLSSLETDADKLADSIKRKVFQEMPNLKLSEKLHLRYFTLHIENTSDVAQNVADLPSDTG
jgi:uncharacterized protein Yka (UPF0111/DUF47 family)